MSNIGQRVFAFTMAAVFLVSSCAVAGFALYQQHQDRKTAAAQKVAQQQSTASQGKPMENYTPVDTVSSLQSTDIKVGDGAEAKAGDSVTVDYTGAVAATGKIFQSSKDTGQPATLSLNSVIDGWKQGIPGMKEGGTRRLLIPAEQAYGPNPPQGSGIPANAALVFDVTLRKVDGAASEATPPAAPQPEAAPESQPANQ